ncbi:MAG: hypothetical protein J7518_02490 [Nocardioidaceae bacterium]|nr:hypothetical protein [Nocardioidaceae bacterium]
MILRARSVPVVLLSAALSTALLAGCGGNDEPPKSKPSVTLPTGNVNVPAGVKLTKAGTQLKFGESATVAYEPNAERNSVLQLTVTGVTQGSIADLGSYVLDDRTKASNPYYVRVAVKNVGDGDVGQTPIPLWAVDSTNTLIQASSFTNSFTKCPSTPLPTTFAPNAAATACLVYLVPNHGTLTGVSFRPLQAFAPIVWKGPITPAPAAQKKAAS